MQGFENSLRTTQHYIVFRIGADTDIFNGRIGLVQETLKKLEAREDYIACQALYDALQHHVTSILEETETAA